MNALTGPISGIAFDGYRGRGFSSSLTAPHFCFLRPQIEVCPFGLLNSIAGKESKLLIRPFTTCLSSDTQVPFTLFFFDEKCVAYFNWYVPFFFLKSYCLEVFSLRLHCYVL